jgi:hypothetical protein
MKAPKHSEARRLLALNFKLCELKPMQKAPVGNDWQLSPVTSISDNAGGYGVLLADNNLCSIDPDNVDLARDGLANYGFDIDALMNAGVRTTSTRPGSGGRSAFSVTDGLRWIKFSSKKHGTILELRATSSNLQDCLPGTVYKGKNGEGPYRQDYAGTTTLDQAPALPAGVLAWWLRMSTDIDFLHQEQRKLVGPDVQFAVSNDGKKLAFNSKMRTTFNAHANMVEILERHAYVNAGRGRWAPPTATGAASVRGIPGKDGLWQSDHASDPLHGTFDAWVAFVVLDHGGDLAAAESAYEGAYCGCANDTFEDLTEAQTTDERTKTDDARREYQKRESTRMGEGAFKVPAPELVTLNTALERFVFLSDGSRVADIFNPHYDLAFSDWVATFAASTVRVQSPSRPMANGGTSTAPDREVPISALWKANKLRKTAVCRTFQAGGNMLLVDPGGRTALNTWKPYDRSLTVSDPTADGVGLFIDHIEFLFGKDSARFLDWLAHIEQRPGELPHTAWLHIARNFGMGRGWLAAVLARLWAGNVAANLDLVQLLRGNFNGQLSRKVLATVDEIREGGRDTQWEHAERLKSLITEEHRHVNPKYGRQSVEFNACRWLLFSNHMSAIPMETGDRRFEVVVLDAAPRGVDYYAKLYNAINSPRFIAAVATFLGQRDITQFKPGAHAVKTEAKQAATQASMSPISQMCELLVRHWGSDIISAENLRAVFDETNYGADYALTAAHRRALEQVGVVPWGVVRLTAVTTAESPAANPSKKTPA